MLSQQQNRNQLLFLLSLMLIPFFVVKPIITSEKEDQGGGVNKVDEGKETNQVLLERCDAPAAARPNFRPQYLPKLTIFYR